MMVNNLFRASGFTHESAKNQTKDWYTPSYIFDALGLEFDLDPCSPGKDIVPWIPAKKHLTLFDDGLAKPWAGRVWLNPPYGKDMSRWLARLAEHADGIALVFNRTSTQWFQKYAVKADVICFINGRISFIQLDGTKKNGAGTGSMLMAYGDECVRAVIDSGLGVVFRTMK